MIWKKEFPLIEKDYPILSRIFPIAQHAAAKLIEYAPTQDIDRIIIFGSSTRWDFRNDSDIDICVDTQLPIVDIIRDLTHVMPDDIPYDILRYCDCEGLLKSEIDKGVVIYERASKGGRS